LAGPLILLASLGPADFVRLDALRRQHYPVDRNRVPAHLTVFRSLPPSAEDEVRRVLTRISSFPPPKAAEQGLMDLGGGVAIRIRSEDLDRLREELSEDFHGLLSAQDRGGWIPHVTIQNKVEPKVARALLRSLEKDFRPRPLQIAGLELVRHSEGEWERLANYRFRGVS
jgi:DNA-binding Lrp family transcriptional regulator